METALRFWEDLLSITVYPFLARFRDVAAPAIVQETKMSALIHPNGERM